MYVVYSRIFPASNEGTLENVEQCQRTEAGTEVISDAAFQCLESKSVLMKTSKNLCFLCFSLTRKKNRVGACTVQILPNIDLNS